MALHMIRGFIAANDGMTDSEIQTAIDDWISARTKWSGDPTDVTKRTRDVEGTGTQYFHFYVRFTWDSDSRDNTLQKCADKFKNKVDWFGLGYHVCEDFEDNQGSCDWDKTWYWPDKGTIPGDVPVPESPTEVTA